MKYIRYLFLFLWIILFTAACGVGDLLPAQVSVAESTKIVAASATATPAPFYTLTPTTVVVFPTPQALPFPDWVRDFSDPILVAVESRHPDLHDEFTSLNRGWFYFVPGSRRNPFYAHLQNGTLLIKLPAENEKKDAWVYNPKLIRKNFVLSFEFQFEATQPDDIVRFQFDQTAEQSVALDLSKNLNWSLHAGTQSDSQSMSGTFDYLAPESIKLLVIMRGEECAFYLNGDPLTYMDHCRSGPIVRASPWAVTFHMLAEPGHVAAVTIDNLKLWDLDKLPR